jgi:hypothetical protein
VQRAHQERVTVVDNALRSVDDRLTGVRAELSQVAASAAAAAEDERAAREDTAQQLVSAVRRVLSYLICVPSMWFQH